MIRVEITLADAFEVWTLPSKLHLPWWENNTAALQVVFADLKRRAAHSLSLDGLEMYAQDLEFRRADAEAS